MAHLGESSFFLYELYKIFKQSEIWLRIIQVLLARYIFFLL